MLDSLSILGWEYLFIVIAGIVLICLITQSRAERRRILLFGSLTLPVAYVVGKLCGYLYDDPRPFVAEHFSPLIPHGADTGFPSDHVLLCASIAAIVYPSNRWLSLSLWAVTLLVGASRVRAGIHHPIDIIGSISIAIVVAWLIYRAISPSLLQSTWFGGKPPEQKKRTL